MEYKNLRLIGTSHIAKQSLEDVKNAMEELNPGIVALELDKRRYLALTSKKKGKNSPSSIFKIGLKGYLFSLIGAWAEKKLGEIVNVEPGSEMVLAIKLAKKNKIKIALVDQDIEITLRRFSKTLSWKEKWNFIVDLFNGFILRKKEVEFDLRTVPKHEIIEKMINQVKKRYPNIYKVLIEERNEVMALNLRNLINHYPDEKILAIVGAGHEKEIVDLIKKETISYSMAKSS